MAFQSSVRKSIKFFAITVVLLFHTVLFAGVSYVFPHYEVTRVTGVEVKRVDKDGPITRTNLADGPIRDVYYIYTQKDNSEKPMVYRNEDTRWGFPFYFKFGSANLQAQASNFQNEHKLVQVKYYGWRLTVFDEYRNAVSMKEAADGETASYPVLSWIFYALFVLSFILCIQFIRGWFDSEA